MLGGILTGIDQSLVNLQSINSTNTMIGIVIVGRRFMINLKPLLMEKLENYP